jgi:hypothetical protein
MPASLPLRLCSSPRGSSPSAPSASLLLPRRLRSQPSPSARLLQRAAASSRISIAAECPARRRLSIYIRFFFSAIASHQMLTASASRQPIAHDKIYRALYASQRFLLLSL